MCVFAAGFGMLVVKYRNLWKGWGKECLLWFLCAYTLTISHSVNRMLYPRVKKFFGNDRIVQTALEVGGVITCTMRVNGISFLKKK